jgi:hypothetical protein
MRSPRVALLSLACGGGLLCLLPPLSGGASTLRPAAGAIDGPVRIGSNYGAVRFCVQRYPADLGSRFEALLQLAHEAYIHLAAENQQRAERARLDVERSGRWFGQPLTLIGCERVREQFLDHIPRPGRR